MNKLSSICIIDDDEIYTFLLKKTLKKIDVCNDIKVYINGADGIEKIKALIENNEELPDLILLDINMPLLDGWEFLDEYIKFKQKIDKRVSIYIVSSSISIADIDKATRHQEVIDFLTKPIEADTIQKICAKHNQTT
ncbi:MAG: response regulator [Candidatus Methylacidiphilales bacterium]